MSVSTDFTKLPGGERVRQVHVGRWTLGITRRYEGDRYGFKGSDGWTLQFTLIRNPVRP